MIRSYQGEGRNKNKQAIHYSTLTSRQRQQGITTTPVRSFRRRTMTSWWEGQATFEVVGFHFLC